MKLTFSDRALSDLEAIGTFIERDSPDAARRHLQKLVERTKQLEKFPESGRIVPEFQEPQLRELIEGNYRIVYELFQKKSVIIIITIFESHKLLKKR